MQPRANGDGHCPTVTENSGNLIASRRRGWDYPVNSGQQDPNVDLGTSMRCVVSPDGAPELTVECCSREERDTLHVSLAAWIDASSESQEYVGAAAPGSFVANPGVPLG